MKKRIVSIVNGLIGPFGAKVVGRDDGSADLNMPAMIRRLASRDISVRTIVDIGASNGKWSIACLPYFPDAAFLAVEPLEERRPALEAAQSRYANFDYALCVAGEVDGGEVRLNVTDDLDGSTVDGRNPGVVRACCVRTIDSLLAEKKMPGPYLLKFDTHGY